MAVEGLHRLALERSEQAIANGALLPLSTEVERCQGRDDTYFELRHLLGGVPRHLRAAGPKPNPFRPWDPRLAVAPIADTHMNFFQPVALLDLNRATKGRERFLSGHDRMAQHQLVGALARKIEVDVVAHAVGADSSELNQPSVLPGD